MDATTFMLQNSAFLQAIDGLALNSELRFCPQGREYQTYMAKRTAIYEKVGVFIFDERKNMLVGSFSDADIKSGAIVIWCLSMGITSIKILS